MERRRQRLSSQQRNQQQLPPPQPQPQQQQQQLKLASQHQSALRNRRSSAVQPPPPPPPQRIHHLHSPSDSDSDFEFRFITLQILYETIVSFALAVSATDDARYAAIQGDPAFYASIEQADLFQVPNSQKEIAYLRLRLRIHAWQEACCAPFVSAWDIGCAWWEALCIEMASLLVFMEVLWARACRLIVTKKHPSNGPANSSTNSAGGSDSDSAVSLSPVHGPTIHSSWRPCRITFLLVTQNNANSISQLCSHLLATTRLLRKRLGFDVPIVFVVLDQGSTDGTPLICQRVLGGTCVSLDVVNVGKRKQGLWWGGVVSQELRERNHSENEFVLTVDASNCKAEDAARLVTKTLHLLSSPSWYTFRVAFGRVQDSGTPPNNISGEYGIPTQWTHLRFLAGRCRELERGLVCSEMRMAGNRGSTTRGAVVSVACGVEDAGTMWMGV